jgi:hypothetical protein
LNLVKAHACAGMANYFTVRDAAADTDDHGGGSEIERGKRLDQVITV